MVAEFEDPGFGVRASNIHSQLMASLQKQQQQQQQRPGTQPAVSGARVFEAIRRQTDMLSQLQFAIRELKGNKLRAARATAKLQELVNESGACGELTALRVPCPLDPNILLDGE
jgi:phosphatidylinositol 3-kinase